MKFSETHEWIIVDDQTGAVGVTDYAQKELGEIVYVELPEVGASIVSGEEAAVLESTKAATDVYSPVSGIIREVNTLLNSHPELINESPEDRGWIFKLELANKEELDALMDAEAYQASLHTQE
ncbi:MAG: glycine cleavage system protein GcvH [Waddliaceae bacterium]